MKFQFILVISLFTLLLYTNTYQAQADISTDEINFINSFEDDITGDGLREYIRLQGVKLTKQSKYYRNIWLDITGPFSQQWKLSLNSGYDPSMRIIDLTNDDINDLLFQSANDEELTQYNYQLYTIQNKIVENIALPKHENVKLTFLDDYRFKINTVGLKKPLIFTLSNEEKLMINKVIYDDKGKLKIHKPFNMEPHYSFEPFLISETKGYGLKNIQFLSGINKSDVLATIETLWYYENNKWITLQTTVNIKK